MAGGGGGGRGGDVGFVSYASSRVLLIPNGGLGKRLTKHKHNIK